MELLFSEELGLVLEVSHSDLEAVSQRYKDAGVPCLFIGRTCGFGPGAMVSCLSREAYEKPVLFTCDDHSCFLLLVCQVRICVDGQEVLKELLPDLRALWEDTSFRLECLQADELCVKQEKEGLAKRMQPFFKLSFNTSEIPSIHQLGKIRFAPFQFYCIFRLADDRFFHNEVISEAGLFAQSVVYRVCFVLSAAGPPRVAVVREEGSNGDREMSVSLYMAGFEVISNNNNHLMSIKSKHVSV